MPGFGGQAQNFWGFSKDYENDKNLTQKSLFIHETLFQDF